MFMKSIRLLTVLLMLGGVISAVGEVSAKTGQVEQNKPAQDGESLTQTWRWPEYGLSLEYPASWQATLNSQNFDFILYEQPQDNTGFPTISAQSGAIDPAEDIETIVQQVAGEETPVEAIALGEKPAWRFNLQTEQQTAFFVVFNIEEDRLALMVFAAPTSQWETVQPLMESILASVSIQDLALDHETLNAQMQTLFVETGMLALGNPTAPVKMMEFMDFSCPHCGTYSASIDRILQDYVQTGEIYFQLGVLDIIGGDASRVAAHAQVCGVQLGVGWDMHTLIFSEYAANGLSAYTLEHLTEVVATADLGIDMAEFEACMATEPATDVLASNLEMAQAAGVNSTPSLLFAIVTPTDDSSELSEPVFDFIRTPQGEPYRGGLPLLLVYEHLDSLQQVVSVE
jgi:protein-disulfide isomerase